MVQRLLSPGEIEELDHNAIPRLRQPDPRSVFSDRAARLRQLANNDIKGIPVGDTLRGYLLLMAALVDAQSSLTQALISPSEEAPYSLPQPDAGTVATALAHHMPPLPVSGPRPEVWRQVFSSLLGQLESLAASQPQLTSVLDELCQLDDAHLEGYADAVLNEFRDALNPLHAPFIAAALQVVWTIQASRLDPVKVQPLVTGTRCPVCGSHPVASAIRIGGQSQGYRYLQCSMCSSEWHMVRVKCTCCESTSSISYQSLESAGQPAVPDADASKANDPSKVARAETCDECHTYRKIFNQEHDYSIEPMADDLASLMLDVLVGEAGYSRASGNPLLWFSAE